MRKDLAELPIDKFREEIRAWLAVNCPPEIRRPVDRLQGEEAEKWHRTRYEHGLVAPGWPVEHGGLGLSVEHKLALTEEFELHGVARAFDMGIAMLGPTLIRFGTTKQKEYYLPRILSGEDTWCQGYSEPDAGSDLASLRTSAAKEDNHYIVNGQKIWTSNAHFSSHCFMLVRTSNDGKKQQGISFLLVDLNSRGVSIRPIRNLSGRDELCEVFFDNVRVPISNRVGEEGQGWSIAKSLLGFERLTIGSPGPAQLAINVFKSVAKSSQLIDDPRIRSELAALECRLAELTCLFKRSADAISVNRAIDSDLSILKIVSSELFQRAAEAAMRLAAEFGPSGEIRSPGGVIQIADLYMISRPATIYGGCNEVQRDILAKRWLNLPSP